jgi:hypothetical protein
MRTDTNDTPIPNIPCIENMRRPWTGVMEKLENYRTQESCIVRD